MKRMRQGLAFAGVMCVLAAVCAIAGSPYEAQWYPDPTQQTQELQDAINDPNNVSILLKWNGCDWMIDNQVTLRDNIEIILEPNVVVGIERGVLTDPNERMFRAIDCSNITIRRRGDSGYAYLHVPEPDDPQANLYNPDHCLAFYGCDNVTVEGLSLTSRGGDGIAVGVCGRSATEPSSNISISNCRFERCYRWGLSVNCVDGLTVSGCEFAGAYGYPGHGARCSGGIDLEVNSPWTCRVMSNVLIEDCVAYYNEGAAFVVNMANYAPDDPFVSITLNECRVINNRGNGLNIFRSCAHDAPPALIQVNDLLCTNCRGVGLFMSWYVFDATDDTRVEFNRCEWRGRPPASKWNPDRAALVLGLLNDSDVSPEKGGVHFNQCKLIGGLHRQEAVSASWLESCDPNDGASSKTTGRTRYIKGSIRVDGNLELLLHGSEKTLPNLHLRAVARPGTPSGAGGGDALTH